MLNDYRDGRIDMDEARAINAREGRLTNFHEIWVPGPEVLHDAMLANRIISARPPTTANGNMKYTMLPLYTRNIENTNLGLMPQITTLHSANGVSLDPRVLYVDH